MRGLYSSALSLLGVRTRNVRNYVQPDLQLVKTLRTQVRRTILVPNQAQGPFPGLAPAPIHPALPRPLTTFCSVSRHYSTITPGDRLWALPGILRLCRYSMSLPAVEAQALLHQ